MICDSEFLALRGLTMREINAINKIHRLARAYYPALKQPCAVAAFERNIRLRFSGTPSAFLSVRRWLHMFQSVIRLAVR